MAETREEILIALKFKLENLAAINQARAAVGKVKADYEDEARFRGKLQHLIRKENITRKQNTINLADQTRVHSGFLDTMGASLPVWQKMNAGNVRFTTLGGRVANRIRMMTQGMRGFRMEMLSVMFFGMGLSRVLIGLLQPALEAMGVFDIWRAVLEILFLPVAEDVNEELTKLLDAVDALPESVKKAIGEFTILGAILSTVLFVIGMMTLGIGGLIEVFGKVGVVLKGFATLTAAQFAILAVLFLPLLVLEYSGYY
jgi:hypothetical protein